jgi:hypothetical protein
MRSRGLRKRADPTPWPSYSTEEAWIQKKGELVLTNQRLLFLAQPVGLFATGSPTLDFAMARYGLTVSVIRPVLGSAQLEILVGANPVRFAVKEPTVWYDLLTGVGNIEKMTED